MQTSSVCPGDHPSFGREYQDWRCFYLFIIIIMTCLLDLCVHSYFVCQIQSRKVTLYFVSAVRKSCISETSTETRRHQIQALSLSLKLLSFYLMLIPTATDMSYCWWHKYVARFIVKVPLYLLICIPPHISHTHLHTVLQVFFIIWRYHFQRLLLFTSMSVPQIRMWQGIPGCTLPLNLSQ